MPQTQLSFIAGCIMCPKNVNEKEALRIVANAKNRGTIFKSVKIDKF